MTKIKCCALPKLLGLISFCFIGLAPVEYDVFAFFHPQSEVLLSTASSRMQICLIQNHFRINEYCCELTTATTTTTN